MNPAGPNAEIGHRPFIVSPPRFAAPGASNDPTDAPVLGHLAVLSDRGGSIRSGIALVRWRLSRSITLRDRASRQPNFPAGRRTTTGPRLANMQLQDSKFFYRRQPRLAR